MKYDFCTLFDKNYLIRGLALYESLLKHCPDFDLWILCMDDESFNILTALRLNRIKPIKLSDLEDEALLSVKNTRTPTEYCWMMSSSLPLYLLEKKGVEMITYLDADMYFFNSPKKIYDEFGDNSIMIIPHRFSNTKNEQESSGIFNVSMLVFKNDSNALECLRWWKERVVEWCFNRREDGKYGDQLYLDDWPTRFEGIYVLKNRGANIASWNIKGYDFFKKNSERWLKVKNTSEEFPVIFYHYHGLKMYLNAKDKVKAYPVTVLESEIYGLYLKAVEEVSGKLWQTDPNWKYGFAPRLGLIKNLKQLVFRLLKI